MKNFQTGKEVKEPTLDEVLKEFPPSDEEIEMDYDNDEDFEEECDTIYSLMEFEKPFYDEEGNFYPDGYYDEDGNVIPGAKKKG